MGETGHTIECTVPSVRCFFLRSAYRPGSTFSTGRFASNQLQDSRLYTGGSSSQDEGPQLARKQLGTDLQSGSRKQGLYRDLQKPRARRWLIDRSGEEILHRSWSRSSRRYLLLRQ